MQKRNIIFCRSKMRFSTQILCATICLLAFLLIVTFVSSYYLLVLGLEFLESSSQRSMSLENQNQITNLNRLLSTTLDQYIMLNAQQSQKLSEIFEFTQAHNLETINPIQCLNETLYPDPIERELQFCYEYYGNKDYQDKSIGQYFLKMTSLLSQYLEELITTNYVYFSSIAEDQFFSIYNLSIPSTYQPKKREWYINHLKTMDHRKICVSEPFYQLSSVIHVAFTYNLTSLNGTLVGIGVKDLKFQDLPNFKNDSIGMTIVDNTGMLVLSKLYKENISQIYNIGDQNVTGISVEQWQFFQERLTNQSFYRGILDNSLTNKKYSFAISKLKKNPFYVILQIDNHQFQDDQKKLVDKYQAFKIDYFFRLLYLNLIVIGISLILKMMAFSRLEKNLNQITQMARMKIYFEYFKSKRNINNSDIQSQFSKIGIIQELYLSFIHLLNGVRQKNQFCGDLEKMKYPKNNLTYEDRCLIQKIKTQIKGNNNTNNSNSFRSYYNHDQ